MENKLADVRNPNRSTLLLIGKVLELLLLSSGRESPNESEGDRTTKTDLGDTREHDVMPTQREECFRVYNESIMLLQF